MSQILIRCANKNDLDEIFKIECEGLLLWNKKQFSDELGISFSKILIAELNGLIAGFAVIWLVTDEIQLHNISVITDSRRFGIGKKLIEYIAGLKKNDMNKISLEVNEKNEQAVLFYEKLGFTKNGSRSKYYGEDSAILMELVL